MELNQYDVQTEQFRQFVAGHLERQTAELERANRLAERSMHALSSIQVLMIVLLIVIVVSFLLGLAFRF